MPSVILRDILGLVLDYVFGLDSSKFSHSGTAICSPACVDFIWSLYVVSRCAPKNCPCISRAVCVMNVVLAQSRDTQQVAPWCWKLHSFLNQPRHVDLRLEYLSRISNILSKEEALVSAEEITTHGYSRGVDFVFRCWQLDVKDERTREFVQHLMHIAVKSGDINCLDFVHKIGLTGTDVRKNDNLALKTAAFYGHVQILDFLFRKWKLHAEDARSGHNHALQVAAMNGHVAVLRYLHTTWHLTSEDARSNNNCALRMAAMNGHIGVLEFLRNTWELRLDDTKSLDDSAVQMAASNGHVAVLDLFRFNWNLTAEHARSGKNLAIRLAETNGHVHVLEYMHRTWKLTDDHARSQGN